MKKETHVLGEVTDILTEETLLKETERLAHVGSWQFNFKTGIGKWSDEAYRLIGYEPGAVAPLLSSFLKQIHPDDLDYVLNAIKEVEADAEMPSKKVEHRVILNNTKEVRYLVTKIIIERDELGQKNRAVGFNQDITSAKLAQQKFLQSQAQLLTAQRMAHIGNVEVSFSENDNIQDYHVTFSDEVFRIFGLPVQKTAPSLEEIYKIIHPADLDFVKKILSRARETGENYNIEYRVIRPDNMERFLYSKGEVVKDELSGKPIKLIATMQDITERKEEEQTLQRANAKLKTIFDNTDITYILVNRDLKVVSFNKLALELFNKEMAMTMNTGDNMIDFIAPDRKQRALEMYKRVFEGETFKLEDNYILKDGSTFWYYMQLLPIYGDDGKVFKMMLSFRNITINKTAEIEREKITANLIQRNKDLEQFSYIISHNLRLPVANLLGLAHNFSVNQLSLCEQKEIISAIYISTRRLDDVVMELNKILEIKNGDCENKQAVKLSNILSNTKVALGYLIKKENAVIESDFSETDELFTVKSYMSSVFYNLILNGIKFRKPLLSPRIIINCIKKYNKVILSFSDNGLGIDLSKNSDGVFGLYKRFHSHDNGKGMGLFMVKAQVESMGGKINVTSDVNNGTTFTIELEQ
jgi:PAS domain S-box-containing protein